MPQEGEPEPTGQEPGNENKQETASGQEPKVFDEDYVKKLRAENADWRTKAQSAQSKVTEFENASKSEQEKLTERAETAERDAATARREALQAKVGAAKQLPPELWDSIVGDDEKAMNDKADAIVKAIGGQQRTGSDGGAREPAPAGGMDALIRGSVGRG